MMIVKKRYLILQLISALGLLPSLTYSSTPTTKTKTPTKTALDWVASNKNHLNNTLTDCTICDGYYQLSPFALPGNPGPFNQSKTYISSKSTTLTPSGQTLTDNVYLYQQGRDLRADTVHLTRDPKTGDMTQINATGHVRYREPSILIIGKNAHWQPQKQQAQINDVQYRFKLKKDRSSQKVTANNTQLSNPGTGYAHGSATTVSQQSPTLFVLHNATYSTCAPIPGQTWQLKAKSIKLNQQTGRGEAYDAVLDIKGVPLLYTPYFNFPINNQRQSGFLYPTINFSNDGGLSLTTPYYLNLAPNYDDTIMPTLYTKRGLFLQNEFRYLFGPTTGQLNTSYIHNDHAYGNKRYNVFFGQQTQFTPNLNVYLQYNLASDKDVFNDFSLEENTLANSTNIIQLPRSAGFSYITDNLNFNGNLTSYQFPDPTLSLGNRYYAKLPELNFSNAVNFNQLQLGVDSQYINFYKAPVDNVTPPTGQRSYLAPYLAWSGQTDFGYFKPSLSYSQTYYNLNNNTQGQDHLSRGIPILDLDSGLYFDRNVQINNTHYKQTLESRLYYLYVPYRDQNQIPIFDSGIKPFDYNSLFTNNRYYGIDRIGDTNQISLALESALINNNGEQIIKGGIGQIFYFHTRKVHLSPAESGLDHRLSDLTSFLSWNMLPSITLSTNINWSTYDHRLTRDNYNIQYKPDLNHIFNVGYTHDNENYGVLSQDDLINGVAPPNTKGLYSSMYWALNSSWRLFGGGNYLWFKDQSTSKKRLASAFAGIEYSSCCSAIRFFISHSLKDDDPNDVSTIDGRGQDTIMLQFLLKGLSRFGSGSINNLLQQINGYQGDSGFERT
ncbi:Organic solvent tolerance protein [Piscirickettsia salmonis]|uniref:LPS-assembly protein LptD n=2 Tax=Piscirickettsia salmonis TaxID=1238 RepID=A0A9Q5YLM0_PISSA|nr:LPS assembly protein LptD [Piscirickettsia salmonis]WGZ70338.1 LPS-assembly protein LptD [Piscirickettsia salmonis EM-90]ALA24081.1 OstA-like family protein [Piscirickettsia salmonis]PEQ17588.1 LPS-assembly protein LptD [Piscirickettsia salmonis]QGN76453.1 Organic solvent tolerance protein [Piscirickettsia salmonis]QGN80043.1 Organic solvent tolerance protein [Piscirickettsia salmonis]